MIRILENIKFQNATRGGNSLEGILCLSMFGLSTRCVRNLEKHRSSRMFDAAWLEIPDFTIRIAVPGCIWNAIVSFSYHKTYPIQYREAAPSAASHLNLHIRSDCSSAISRNPHTSRGYHTVPPSQARSLPWTDHSSRLQYRPVFSP